MYFLKKSVYIVSGAKKDCIYDLNTGKLYHIDKKISELIYKNGYSNSNINSEEEYLMLKKLEEVGIIDCKLSGGNKDISEIKIKSKIKMAWIEVCTNCNLKCIHCYNDSSEKCSNYMSLEDFKFVCDELQEYGIKKVQIIGGEPFCNPNIKDMITYIAGKFDKIEIFTNATLLNEELIKLIKNSNIMIAISVYSYIPDEHNKVTKVDTSYFKTTENMKLLQKYNIKYRTSTTMMNGIEIGEKNTDLYEIENRKYVIKMSGRGNINLLDSELLKSKLITKKSFQKKIYLQFVSENVSGHPCYSQKIYISANLDVYPCAMERRFCHGNLSNHKLCEILDETILNFNKDRVDICKDCEFRYACYDCRPDSLSKNKTEKPYNCTYDVYNGRWLDENEVIKQILNQ